MKKTLLMLVVLSTCISSCTDTKSSTNQNQEDLAAYYIDEYGKVQIKDKIIVDRKLANTQFPGTQIFYKNNDRFVYDESTGWLMKGDNCKLLFVQTNNFSVGNSIKKVKENIDLHGGVLFKVYQQKDFKLGKYDAFLLHGSSDKKGYHQYVIVYGDEKTSVNAIGEFRADIPSNGEEILDIIFSSYLNYKAELPVDELEELTNIPFNKYNFSNISKVGKSGTYGMLNDRAELIENVVLVVNADGDNRSVKELKDAYLKEIKLTAGDSQVLGDQNSKIQGRSTTVESAIVTMKSNGIIFELHFCKYAFMNMKVNVLLMFPIEEKVVKVNFFKMMEEI